jgi:hypothetical protein
MGVRPADRAFRLTDRGPRKTSRRVRLSQLVRMQIRREAGLKKGPKR